MSHMVIFKSHYINLRLSMKILKWVILTNFSKNELIIYSKMILTNNKFLPSQSITNQCLLMKQVIYFWMKRMFYICMRLIKNFITIFDSKKEMDREDNHLLNSKKNFLILKYQKNLRSWDKRRKTGANWMIGLLHNKNWKRIDWTLSRRKY